MRKLIHASLLITGTTIGAGFLALPLSGINIDIKLLAGLIFFFAWVAHYASMMAIDLNILHQKPAAMDQLSRVYAGKRAFAISLTAIYLISFALLTGYFDCFADTVCTAWGFSRTATIWILAIFLFCVFNLDKKLFSNINSFVVSILLIAILLASLTITITHPNVDIDFDNQWKDLPGVIPILFTSFLMQTICPRIYKDLNYDRKKISQAFWLGTMIPAIIYLLWIICVLKNIVANNPDFFKKLQSHNVSVGALIQFLCDSSPYSWLDLALKILTLLGVITSAIGFGIGLLQSLEAFIPHGLARLLVCLIPAAINVTFPNVFIKVFSFAGMISTILVIFMPYYLLSKQTRRTSLIGLACCLLGIAIILCEWM
ncbi:MAG: hypothetical protein J6Z25_03475 [Opitutales bacterium]|nr:hypothetical protein [Opitutales bacterium]